MSTAAELVRLKLLRMQDELKFLEWVWSNQNRHDRDFHINNYDGKVPDKFLK